MIWTIVIRTTADCYRKSISSVISQHQKICCRFRGTIWAAGMDRSLFCKEQIRAIQWQISVHFICRYLMITSNTILSAGIHQNCSSLNIGIQKYFRILNRTVYMTFRCKVHHNIRMFFFK